MANKTDKLNVFLANLAVLNIKVHNLHWNVVGLQFPLIHKMTEKIYKMLQCQFDTGAEVMKMQNKMPAASMAEYLDKTTIDELEARDYHGYEVLEELSADCDILIASAKEVRDEADKADNFQVANLMEEYLDMYAKKSWMIKAMMQDDDLEIADEESDEEDTEEE